MDLINSTLVRRPGLVPMAATYEPTREYTATYDRLYDAFRRIYKANRRTYRKLNR